MSATSHARRRRVALWVCLSAWSLSAVEPARAADTFGSFLWQNDLLLGKDGGGYTNGLYLSQIRVASSTGETVAPPLLLDPVVTGLGLPRPTLAATSIGQIMITPGDLTQRVPDPKDAPYLGALVLRSTYVLVRDADAYMLALNVGVIGPAAGAKPVQRFFHRITGSKDPQGWDTQVSNRLLVGVEGARAWRAHWGDAERHDGGTGADVIAIAHGALGNLRSSAGATLMLRYGQGLQRSYATTPRLLSERGDPLIVDPGWFTFAAVSADRLFHHEGVGSGGRLSQLRQNSLLGAVGVAYGWRETSVNLSVQRASPLADASRAQTYASLGFNWRMP